MKGMKNIFFQLASRNVRLNLTRSLLAALGIIIGVVAITTMGILGANIQLAVSSNLSSNANSVIITPDTGASGGFGGGGGGAKTTALISDNQVREIEQAAGHNTVVPIHSGSDLIQVGTKDKKRVAIYGIDPEKVSLFVDIADGSSLHGSSAEALVGSTLAADQDISVGTRIKIGDETTGTSEVVRVAGILAPKGFGIDLMPDNALVVPDRWYTSVYDDDGEYQQVDVLVPSIDDIPAVKAAIDARMNKKIKVIQITDSGALLQTINSTIGQITLFITLLGGISLLVASVSIFNVMMMSVKDRINEIGVLEEHRNDQGRDQEDVHLRGIHHRRGRGGHRRPGKFHRWVYSRRPSRDFEVFFYVPEPHLCPVRDCYRYRDLPVIGPVPGSQSGEPQSNRGFKE